MILDCFNDLILLLRSLVPCHSPIIATHDSRGSLFSDLQLPMLSLWMIWEFKDPQLFQTNWLMWHLVKCYIVSQVVNENQNVCGLFFRRVSEFSEYFMNRITWVEYELVYEWTWPECLCPWMFIYVSFWIMVILLLELILSIYIICALIFF